MVQRKPMLPYRETRNLPVIPAHADRSEGVDVVSGEIEYIGTMCGYYLIWVAILCLVAILCDAGYYVIVVSTLFHVA